MPKSKPPAPAPDLAHQTAPSNGESITFVLNGIELDGAHAIPPSSLSKIWAPYIGKEVSIAKVYDFANSVTLAYAQAGYMLAFAIVPEQEIENGIVRIRVVEGYVDDVVFRGDFNDGAHPMPEMIGYLSKRIMASRPLRNVDLERALLLMNDIPGISASAVFEPGEGEGASRVILTVTRKKQNLMLTARNDMARDLGRWDFGVDETVNGLLGDASRIRLSLGCGINCHVYQQAGIAYDTFIGSDGFRFGVSIATSQEKPNGGILSAVAFEGRNLNMTVNGSYPLLRTREENLSVGAAFSYINSHTSTFAGTLTQDRVRTASASVNYDKADSTGGTSLYQLTLTQGLPLMNATDDNDPLRSRAAGSATFTNLSLYTTRIQPLYQLSPKLEKFSLFGVMRAQYTISDALLSASQCSYGGSEIGRGYDSGALGGDHCLMAAIEARYDNKWRDVNYQTYGFLDGGVVWRKGVLVAGEDRRKNAESAGIGMRLMPNDRISGDVSVAWPLKSSETSNGKDAPRFLFSLSFNY